MSVYLPWLLAAAAVVTSWALTGVLRRYALRRRVIDVPNSRSSHAVATPRGGGMAIVVAALSALAVAAAAGWTAWAEVWGVLTGGAVVAAVGFADDHGHVSRRWRLLAHVAAAGAVMASLGGLPPLGLGGADPALAAAGYVLGALFIVWVLNLTNFMDGIDGIASTEAVLVSVGGAFLYTVAAPGGALWVPPVMLAASALGFLAWNWPPARIFMGDAGSGFIGLMLGAFSLRAGWAAPELFWSWVILLGVFVVDATTTLLRRLLRGERIYEAHRTHAYQHAAQDCGAHRPVTLAVAAINLFWLLPLAAMVADRRIHGVVGVLVAYAPLVVAARWMGAGVPREKRGPRLAPHV